MRPHGPAIRAIREGRGLSQTRAAVDANMPRSHLANIEAGRRNFSPDVAQRIASALKCDLAAILADPAEQKAS